MIPFKRNFSFLDLEGRRARLDVEITMRNGYPKFTASGSFIGSRGQCIDKIKPASPDQSELIRLWNKYHLQNVEKIHNFREHLEGVIDRITYEEKEREAKAEVKSGDDALLAKMEEEGIEEDMLEAVKAYVYIMGSDDLEEFDEANAGEFTSNEEFARNMAENTGAIDDDISWPHRCIDWERAARELMMDYSEHNGYYFRNL